MSMEISLITTNYYTLKVKEGYEEEVQELIESQDGLSCALVDMMYDNSELTDFFSANAIASVELINIDDETGDEESISCIENIELK